MSLKHSAFDDAMVAVGTANTTTYLLNRLRTHPLVQYLVEKFSIEQLSDKVLQELKNSDRSLQSTTIILLLTQAIIQKSSDAPIPTNVHNALQQSKVMWVSELLSVTQFSNRNYAMTVTKLTIPNLPRTGSSRGVSNTARNFIMNRGQN
ncbi:hypothetical protein [Collimonas sp.]|jgi:hypothetical protein|uniref:hypothetical protein n=1 Tax=Collimonas sp. TaxID=1963772 RepID=UPI002BF26B64|nr:hypothetical protein [Collimonas sp.]HWW08142.1 hypothetical protein [Collimonas sp.]